MRAIPIPSLLFALLLACGLPIQGEAIEKESAALALARKVYDRPLGRGFTERAIMTLTQEGSQPRERSLYGFHLRGDGGERKTLVRFTSPADVQDTALLTHDHAGDESEQWLYLPALKRVRRISASRKGGRFVGSDYFYEDLQDREPDMDHHRLLGKSKVSGLDCTLLESTPVNPGNSVYGKRVSCIHPNVLIPLQVEFYPRRGNAPIKRLKIAKIKKIQGYWTVLDSAMEDLETGHSTRFRIEAVRYDQDLPMRLFTPQALGDPGLGAGYQP
jgi:hypothetical protein